MHTFRVWAPSAQRVELVLGGAPAPMERDDGGWWTRAAQDAGHGADYAYAVDGGVPRPDPRSAWQPDGVHGTSRVFDAGRHEWRDGGWPGRDVLGSLFYELHVGTFTPAGTLDAAIARLPHLVGLGVDVVELMPVAGFDGRWGWGYDGVDLYAVHEPYGGPAALQRFVDAAHGLGLAVCLDVVYNHLGPSGNYLATFGPYFTERHHTPWGAAVNLDDDGAAEVRRWICDNALRWLRDFHVDALRLDAVHALVDDSPRHLLVQLSEEVAELAKELGRPLALVAESDLNDPRMIEPAADGGFGMTAQWSDDLHHALHAALSGERQGYYCDFGELEVLDRTLTRVFWHAGTMSAFRGKLWGRPIDPARHRGHRFLGYLQNHDQVGNRAAGDRLAQTLPPGRLAIGAAIVLTSPFTPMLFMGEEWGATTPFQFFTDFPDPELADAVRGGRRREFLDYGWQPEDVPDPQSPSTRDASVLDWSQPSSGTHAALLEWHRSLIRLRRELPDLQADDLGSVAVEHGDDWLIVHRDRVRVLVNLGPATAVLASPEAAKVLLRWGDAEPSSRGWRLGPESVAVLFVE